MSQQPNDLTPEQRRIAIADAARVIDTDGTTMLQGGMGYTSKGDYVSGGVRLARAAAALLAEVHRLTAEDRFFFDQDQSSHWYIVPASERDEWNAWCALDEDDERSWDAPEWAKRIDGPQTVTFTNPSDV